MAENRYVALNSSQQTYAKKGLLQSEMNLLNTIKRYRRYKKLRKEELALKSMLKRTITELQDAMRKLDASLPEMQEYRSRPTKITKTGQKRKDIEHEIAEIKRKIAQLQ